MIQGQSTGHISRIIPQDDLVQVAEIGTGSFSTVKLVSHQDPETNEVNTYALKVLSKKPKQEECEMASREASIMRRLDHPFVLHLVCEYNEPSQTCLLLEYVPGRGLFEVVHTKTRDGMDLKDCQFYAACIMNALRYLHHMSVIYRDLKPENVMIDEAGYAKVIDFGSAKVLRAGGRTYTLGGGTVEYMAPEVILGRGYDHAIDWWTFGTPHANHAPAGLRAPSSRYPDHCAW